MGGSIGQVNSGNAYVYAGNDPVMMTDPSGACFTYTEFFAVLGAVAAIFAIGLGIAAAFASTAVLPFIAGIALSDAQLFSIASGVFWTLVTGNGLAAAFINPQQCFGS